jgi:hypothetical protein
MPPVNRSPNRMKGRALLLTSFGLSAGIAAVLLAIGIPAMHNRLTYGTFSTEGPPPRVDYCGRRYYPGSPAESRSSVDAFLARNGLSGLTRVGTTPSGMPIVANVMSPATRASYHTNICTMGVWVQTGADSYLPYALSGGP